MRVAHLLSRNLHGLNGVSAQKIFEWATIGGARALQASHLIGSLEVGKDADFLVVEIPERVVFNPKFAYESLIHSITASNVAAVFVRGRRVS